MAVDYSIPKDEYRTLLELVDVAKDLARDLHCESCEMRRDCEDNNRVFCDGIAYFAIDSIRECLRELGVEL